MILLYNLLPEYAYKLSKAPYHELQKTYTFLHFFRAYFIIYPYMYINGGIDDTGPWHKYRRYPGVPFWIFAIHRSGSYVIHHSNGSQVEHDPTGLLLIEPNTTYEVI